MSQAQGGSLRVTLSREASRVIGAVATQNHLSVDDLTSLAVMSGLKDTAGFSNSFEEWLEERRDKGCRDVYDVDDQLMRRGKRFKGIRSAQRYVEEVCAGEWWQRHFAGINQIQVRHTRSKTEAYVKVGSTNIHLPTWGRNQIVVLHEMAHIATPEQFQPHGSEYTRLYCDLVREEMGAEVADVLMNGLRERGVRIGQSERVYNLCQVNA